MKPCGVFESVQQKISSSLNDLFKIIQKDVRMQNNRTFGEFTLEMLTVKHAFIKSYVAFKHV